jgi:Asp-tRNA(Asn)/Glu-tRNA(Gln) amidotransferase A subunit family amidase
MVLSRQRSGGSLVGSPALSVPCGTVDGLPVGLQVVAPPDREDLIVAVVAAIERLGG